MLDRRGKPSSDYLSGHNPECVRKPGNPVVRFWPKVEKTPTCWIWMGSLNNQGYGKFGRIGHDGWMLAHRFSWEREYGPVPTGLYVLHKCDNPKCVRPVHLFLGTAQDNHSDMRAKGRMRVGDHSGEHNGRAKLNWEKVQEIRGSTLPLKELVTLYGVGETAIFDVRAGRSWRRK